MAPKTVLLLYGGGGPEHEVSILSAKYIYDSLSLIEDFTVFQVEICKDQIWRRKGPNCNEVCELHNDRKLIINGQELEIDFIIPCIHGPPGETGDIQSIFEMIKLPYLGCGPEASKICFNKITSKLWLSSLNIPNTPYTFLSSINELDKAIQAFQKWGTIFIKPASQGSSVGCYMVTSLDHLEYTLIEAFKYSPYVLIEKSLVGRELEVSVYQYEGKLHVSDPGEIICPTSFYSYEEKYAKSSQTKTVIKASNLDKQIIQDIKDYTAKSFRQLKLRHLARVDFFYSNDGEVYLNELNTFPGMTPISMFPKMMENNGHKFSSFLENIIRTS